MFTTLLKESIDQILGNRMQMGALFQVFGTTGLHDVLEVFGP